MNKKTVFIIPGYKHKPQNKAYKQIAKILKNEGYLPIPVKIPWRKSTISENTDYFLKEFKKIKSKKKYIIGFSFGAMIAFIASTKVKVEGLFLCSLSPYFKEDLSKKNKFQSSLMIKRYYDFSTLRCSALAKQIRTKRVVMMYGEKEEKSLIKRVTKTYRKIPSSNKYLTMIIKADHDISDKKYIHAIGEAIA